MSVVFHDDPFTPFDRQPLELKDALGENLGHRRCGAIPAAYVPVPADALRLRVGARQLNESQWVSTIDEDWPRFQEMKRALIAERRDEVVASTPGDEVACEEVAAGVARSVGLDLVNGRGIDALVDVALQIADDLCILLPDENGVMRLRAAVLCSPNRWRLTEKLGGTMGSIHMPVARYDSDLDSPVNAVLARLSVGRALWRTNWGITNHPSFFQPDIPPPTPDINPADMWMRVEWQTLRKLPISGGVLFTIRTYVEKFSDFVLRDYEVVHGVSDLVDKIHDDVATYKSIAIYRDKITTYLDLR